MHRWLYGKHLTCVTEERSQILTVKVLYIKVSCLSMILHHNVPFYVPYLITSSGLPPSTVNSIDIVNGTVDVVTSTIQLNITWEPPYPYGELQYYDLRLTAEVNGTANYTFGGRRIIVRSLPKPKSEK